MARKPTLDPRTEALNVVAKVGKEIAELEMAVKAKLELLDSLGKWFKDNDIPDYMFMLTKSPVEFYLMCYDTESEAWYIRSYAWILRAMSEYNRADWAAIISSSHCVDTIEGMRYVERAPLTQLINEIVLVGHDKGHPFKESDLALYETYRATNKHADAPADTDMR